MDEIESKQKKKRRSRQHFTDPNAYALTGYGRVKDGLILPNKQTIYCPSVTRPKINATQTTCWKRYVHGSGIRAEFSHDRDHGGCSYKSLAAILESLLFDLMSQNDRNLPIRLRASFGSISRIRNQTYVFYYFFDGKNVKKLAIPSDQPEYLLVKIHEQQLGFMKRYLAKTITILKTDPDKLASRQTKCSPNEFINHG